MKKIFNILLLLLILLSFTPHCGAQDVRKIEGEANLGITTPISNFHNGEKQAGPELGLELRYNFPSSPWDCGVLLNVTTSVYKLKDPYRDLNIEQSNRSANFIIVGDYNFKQGSNFNPYIGCGVGYSLCDVVYEVAYEYSGTKFVLRPRAGIELCRHFIVGAFADINRKGYSNMGISFGAVIGGGKRRHKTR